VKPEIVRHAVTEAAVSEVTRAAVSAPEREFGAKLVAVPAEPLAMSAKTARPVVFRSLMRSTMVDVH
jgi:hypothetical protein